MARYLLDTNILVYLLLKEEDNISNETYNIIDDYNSQIYTSSICVMEIIQLYRIGKIKSVLPRNVWVSNKCLKLKNNYSKI